ncbi:MAG: insulinase family protein [Alphaproteobacteria bacterium]|nr:insulinase family protein [Alphaproteobacteria bacterium]
MKHTTALKALSVLALFIAMPHGTATAQSIEAERAATPEPTEERGQKVFNAETFTLDNGLEVVVIPNDRAPVLTHMVWYKVGAADEPIGTSGIAHYLEHMLFKGSKQVGGRELAPGEFSEIIRSMGGNDNAFTSQDYTAYFQSVPSEHLETVMRMEAGRMMEFVVPRDAFESERQVILEERRQRTDNDPRGQFGEQMAAAAYVNHPYSIPVIGWKHEMEVLSYEDAKGFFDKWYAPNNAILVVSGDVTPAEVFEKAIDIYGKIPKKDVPERDRTESPELNSRTLVTLDHPAIRQSVVQTLFRAPSARQSIKDARALEVLEEIMSGGPSSRLYQSLVTQQKIASGAGLSYRSTAWNDGSVYVYATPLAGQTLRGVHEALMEELRTLIKDGVTDKELQNAKNTMRDKAIYARDSLTGPAMIMGLGLSTGESIENIEYWPDEISDVTAADIQRVAKTYLNPDEFGPHPPVSGYLLPQGEKSGEE